MTGLLASLLVGFAFGALLQKAGLSRYDRIVNVYRFRDLAVIEFLLTAVAVGAVGLRALTALGLAGSVPVPSTFLVGNFTGGVVFGVGMALSGFCPGTIAAGIGEGRLDYLVPGVLGLVTGGLVVGAVYRWILPIVGRGAVAGATLPALAGADPWLVVVLVAEVAALVVYCIERASPGARVRADDGDGPGQSDGAAQPRLVVRPVEVAGAGAAPEEEGVRERG